MKLEKCIKLAKMRKIGNFDEIRKINKIGQNEAILMKLEKIRKIGNFGELGKNRKIDNFGEIGKI